MRHGILVVQRIDKIGIDIGVCITMLHGMVSASVCLHALHECHVHVTHAHGCMSLPSIEPA